MLILLESVTEIDLESFFNTVILNWRDFRVVLFSGWFCL